MTAPLDPSEDELARHWSLTPADLAVIAECRGPDHRRRFAVQLCMLRAHGRFLDDYRRAPIKIVNHLSRQLGLPPVLFLDRAGREPTERVQAQRIRRYLGLSRFDAAAEANLRAWLREGALEGRSAPELLAGAEDRLRAWKVMLPGASTLEHLVGQVLQPRHEGNSEQRAEVEQMFGEAVRIGGMFPDRECRFVVEDAAQHVAGLARCAGDGLGGVDAVLVGGVGIELEGAVVIAEVARVDAAEQAVALDGKALAVRGGAPAVAPELAERQAVVMVHQDGVGRFDGGLAQEPSAGILQGVGGERVDALAHGGQAEVDAVGNQGGQQRAVRVGPAGLVAAERPEGAGEAAPLVDVLQQVLDADAPQAGADRGTQFAGRVRDGHGVALLELESPLGKGHAIVMDASSRVMEAKNMAAADTCVSVS